MPIEKLKYNFVRSRIFLIIFLLCVITLSILVYLNEFIKIGKKGENFTPGGEKRIIEVFTPTVTPTITVTPTPRPLTFTEMNNLYGPCVFLPVLMYHHIQTKEDAALAKQTSLTVFTDFFKGQMQYLKDKSYNVIKMKDLANFFNDGVSIPKKSVLLTFDDAYSDFYVNAYPILKEMNFNATVFTPTGLVNNSGYLNWEQIAEMNAGGVYFANHTWSHKNVEVGSAVMHQEISTADTQLSERGLNQYKVFAYPYGLDTSQSETYLQSLGYNAAFTTKPGSILCKKQRFNLPRIRIGNASLSSYGF